MSICVAIKAETTIQTIQDMVLAAEADLIEIRLDYRREPLDLSALRQASKKPLIATNRRKDQGGAAEETEHERVNLLIRAVEAGFEMVDVSANTENLEELVLELKSLGVKVIASYHDFENPLDGEALEKWHNRLAGTGCDVVKLVGWTDSYQDVVIYLNYNRIHPGNVAFGMGEQGSISRILAPLTGAAYTYASLKGDVAPGQIPLKLLRETYRSLSK